MSLGWWPWVRALAVRARESEFEFPDPCKKPGMDPHVHGSSFGRQRQTAPERLLASSNLWLWAQWDPLSQGSNTERKRKSKSSSGICMFTDQHLRSRTPTLEPILKTRLFISCLDVEASQPSLQPTVHSSQSFPPHRTLPSFPPTLTANVLLRYYIQFQSRQGFSSAGKIQFLYQWVLTGSQFSCFRGASEKTGTVQLFL